MGFGRGKVGSVVLARLKGQQVARAYNEAPNNPRSSRQMAQRSIFTSAVKFYTRGVQAFFKFAFENKDNRLSDYNAFMSQNAKLGLRMSKKAFEETTYPAIGPFMMTKGSLGQVNVVAAEDNSKYILALAGLTTSATMGALSQSMIDNLGLAVGDIITITEITAAGSTAENTPDIEPERRGDVTWLLKQFIIDPTSSATIADTLGTTITAAAGQLEIVPPGMTQSACGCAITVSRETSTGLKVSNTYLTLNDIADTIYQAGQSEAYNKAVIASWGAAPEAILQGSLVQ